VYNITMLPTPDKLKEAEQRLERKAQERQVRLSRPGWSKADEQAHQAAEEFIEQHPEVFKP